MDEARTEELGPGDLCRRCDPDQFAFTTTADLEDLRDVVGQQRALEAIRFGVGIERDGYNLFAMGPVGCGKQSIVRRLLEDEASRLKVPSDFCYVHDFRREHRPRAIELPPGRARTFAVGMDRMVEELRGAIPAAFETDEYRARRREIEGEFSERQEKAFSLLQEKAKEKDLTLVRTPAGVAFAPTREGEVMDPEAFAKLPREQREQIESTITGLEADLEKTIHQIPRWRREAHQKIRELNRAVTGSAVGGPIDEMRKGYADLPAVLDYLDQVRDDIIGNAEDFRQPREGEAPTFLGLPLPRPEKASQTLRRYRVNVLIDREGAAGAPVIFEDNPTHANLVGRIEHVASMGVLETDFTLIKPGALHRANGGYLILEAHRLLGQPFAWDGLKRALRSRLIHTEPPGPMQGLVVTSQLEPQPIPLSVKVVLLGERWLYHMFHAADHEFGELFKVAVDFAEDMPRDPQTMITYARLIGSIARSKGLLPLDRGGVARVIDHSSRTAGKAAKMSMQMSILTDLLRESDYWARRGGRQAVTAADVQEAIDAQDRRASRVRERLQEEIRAGTIMIDTDGERVGQVNGLSVIQMGGFTFGHPSRITARVRLGGGKVVDIEREVELGGPIHSKGVLILSGFLAARFAADRPLALSASLVFEQSYGGVEGDSASSAELFALLSALAGAPVRQSIAVTGSVNQNGDVQAIGGVNEKIEGFFDICAARGLTGRQGVIIPASNVQHLMLRRDVVEAAAAGRFHVYPIRSIDDGIAILTGLPAGARDAGGRYAEGTVNHRVEARVIEFAERARAFAAHPAPGTGAEKKGTS